MAVLLKSQEIELMDYLYHPMPGLIYDTTGRVKAERYLLRLDSLLND